MFRTFLACVCLAFIAPLAYAQPKAVKPTIAIFAGGSEDDARILREALEKLPGVKIGESGVKFGDFRRDGGVFTSFTTIEIADLGKADIGTLGKSVASANTSKKAAAPPALYLILRYKPDSIKNEPYRAALAGVKGITPMKSWAGDANLWVSIDGSGQAKLADITKALHAAEVKFRDPLTDAGDK